MENNLTDEQTELLRRNLEISEELLKKTDYIKSYVKWQKFLGVINILLIVTPLILGVLYLPSILSEYFNQLTSLSQ